MIIRNKVAPHTECRWMPDDENRATTHMDRNKVVSYIANVNGTQWLRWLRCQRNKVAPHSECKWMPDDEIGLPHSHMDKNKVASPNECKWIEHNDYDDCDANGIRWRRILNVDGCRMTKIGRPHTWTGIRWYHIANVNGTPWLWWLRCQRNKVAPHSECKWMPDDENRATTHTHTRRPITT